MLTVGEILAGRYRIVREIGAGGMGTVYEGENLRIRRRVAIKIMRAVDEPSAELIARFEREAQVASQIPSDHITEVLDLGELDNGQHFIVMEYLAGEPLSARVERLGRIPPRELVGLVRQVLQGLAAAHSVGVIHRDIKPDNVFILDEKAGQPDFVKLLDFGVSKVRRPDNMEQLTQTGAVVGTPSYMAPEQVSGGEASPLWDLYAVGVLLYRGLTGDVPFKSVQLNDLVYKIALGRFVPPHELNADVDSGLSSIVCRAMARAEHRFQTAEHFIAALDAWLERGTGVTPPPLTPQQTWEGLGGRRGGNAAAGVAQWRLAPCGRVLPPIGLRAGFRKDPHAEPPALDGRIHPVDQLVEVIDDERRLPGQGSIPLVRNLQGEGMAPFGQLGGVNHHLARGGKSRRGIDLPLLQA